MSTTSTTDSIALKKRPLLPVIPWGYVWRTYVRADGDRWR